MTDSPLSIVHVVAPARFGGLESVVRMLASGHRRRGHQVHVLSVVAREWASRDPGHPFAAALQQDGVDVTSLTIGDRQYWRERAALASIIRRVGARVVHTHGFRPDVVDAPIARRDRVRTVSTVHGFIGGTRRSRVYEWIQRRAFRHFDAVAAVSRRITDRLVMDGVPAARVHTIPNAFAADPTALGRIAARTALQLPESSHVIGWVGRLSAEKGPDVALHAVAGLSRSDAVLAVIGDGPDAPALKAAAERLGISDRVRWMGSMPGAGRYFAAFDTFLLSSRTEGTPIVLLEAMAAGVPIVATAVGGVPDLLDPGTAWLVPSEDAVRMTGALSLRVADEETARDKADAARVRVENRHGLDPWLDRYETLYRSTR